MAVPSRLGPRASGAIAEALLGLAPSFQPIPGSESPGWDTGISSSLIGSGQRSVVGKLVKVVCALHMPIQIWRAENRLKSQYFPVNKAGIQNGERFGMPFSLA
jgi:hypothetical protein